MANFSYTDMDMEDRGRPRARGRGRGGPRCRGRGRARGGTRGRRGRGGARCRGRGRARGGVNMFDEFTDPPRGQGAPVAPEEPAAPPHPPVAPVQEEPTAPPHPPEEPAAPVQEDGNDQFDIVFLNENDDIEVTGVTVVNDAAAQGVKREARHAKYATRRKAAMQGSSSNGKGGFKRPRKK